MIEVVDERCRTGAGPGRWLDRTAGGAAPAGRRAGRCPARVRRRPAGGHPVPAGRRKCGDGGSGQRVCPGGRGDRPARARPGQPDLHRVLLDQPDVTVLHSLPADDEQERWVTATLCTMAVEFVRRGDRPDPVDRLRRCATAGVPWFLRVELDRRPQRMTATLWGRDDGGGYPVVCRAVGGQRLRSRLPFPIDFAPARLLPRTRQACSTTGTDDHVGSQRGTNR